MSSQNMSSHHRLYISGIEPLGSKYFIYFCDNAVSENPWSSISCLENNSFEFQVRITVVRKAGNGQFVPSSEGCIVQEHWLLQALCLPLIMFHSSQGMMQGFKFMQCLEGRWKKRAKYYFQFSPTKSTPVLRAPERPVLLTLCTRFSLTY